jgi:hypothetical protein
MKKLLLVMLVFTMSYAVNAQIQTPAPSPASTLIQKVGLTDVTIDYSRPAMRGRTIFGDLVPYGKFWRTGANARTKVTFSEDVTVGGKDVKAGTYAIFVNPQATKWEVVLYSEYQGSGAPQTIDESKVAARVMSDVYPMEMDIQSFTITIDDITSSSAVIGIMWEKAYVPVPFLVGTDKAVMASIEAALAGPSANDYYAAASYMHSEGKDASKAKMYIDKAMGIMKEPAFWQLRQQSLIYAAAGDTKGAIEIAKKSLAESEKAGNADYVKMNKESLAEWQK